MDVARKFAPAPSTQNMSFCPFVVWPCNKNFGWFKVPNWLLSRAEVNCSITIISQEREDSFGPVCGL